MEEDPIDDSDEELSSFVVVTAAQVRKKQTANVVEEKKRELAEAKLSYQKALKQHDESIAFLKTALKTWTVERKTRCVT